MKELERFTPKNLFNILELATEFRLFAASSKYPVLLKKHKGEWLVEHRATFYNKVHKKLEKYDPNNVCLSHRTFLPALKDARKLVKRLDVTWDTYVEQRDEANYPATRLASIDTKALMVMLGDSRKPGYPHNEGSYPNNATYPTHAQLTKELATREHLPNRAERKQLRQEKAQRRH